MPARSFFLRTCGLAAVTLLAMNVSGCGDKPASRGTPPEDAAPVASAAPDKMVLKPATPPPPPLSTRDRFWKALTALCGNAYAGYLTVGTEPGDRDFGEADMTMHVRDCSEDEIRIPFHVGQNRSRTWVLRRDGETLVLKHHHRDENGEIQEPHNYGGRTIRDGTEKRQRFVVDEATRTKLPESRNNVWAIDIVPGQLFAYELQRPEEDRFFRVEFEIDAAVEPPPAAWGYTTD